MNMSKLKVIDIYLSVQNKKSRRESKILSRIDLDPI